jgi:large subunit ribosomal protein L5
MQKLNLAQKYTKEVLPVMAKEFGVANKLAVPRLQKIVVNMGIGDLAKDKANFAKLQTNLAAITGQKPSVRLAKLSVAGFGIRAGMPVGLSVTLRGSRMYDFLGRLTGVVLPRLRDFRGIANKGFDSVGNYTLGLAEYTVFPEVSLEKVDKPRGLEITFVIGGKDKIQSKRLLELLGMPFEKID